MATTIADAYVQIIPSADGISGQLSSIMDGEASAAGTSASGSFGSSFSAGLGTVAKVGAATFGVFTTAVTAGTAALTKGISSVASYGDFVDKTSQKVGMSSDSFQQWDYIMNLAGTSMSECSMGMKTLTNQIDNAKNGSEDAQAMFEQLNISLEDLETMSREDIWSATITGMQNLEDSTERAALANDLFGKSGQNMTPLFNMTNEELQEAIDNTEKYNMVMSEEAVKAAAAYQDSLTTLKASFKGLKTDLLSDFLPSVTTVMDGLSEIFAGDSETGIGLLTEGITGFIDNLTDLAPELTSVGGSILTSIITGLSENSDAILTAGADVIVQLATAITEALPTIASSAIEIIFKLVNSFLELLPELADAGLTILENLLNGIGDNLDTIIPTVVSVVLEITNTLIEHIPDLISAGLSIFSGLIDGLTEAIPLIIDTLPTLVTSILDALSEAIPDIINAGIELFVALVDSMPEIIDSVCEAVPEIVDAIVDFLSGDGVEKMIDAGVALFEAIVTNLPVIITTIVAAIPRIVNSLVQACDNRSGDMANAGKKLLEAIGDGIVSMAATLGSTWATTIAGWLETVRGTISSWKQAGVDLIQGLWNGFKSKIGDVTSGVTTWAANILSAVKNKFGIASPSKAMAEIGTYLAEGLGKGWDETIGDIQKDINGDLSFESKLTQDDTTAAAPLNGVTIILHDTIDLGDTQLKDIISKYTIQQIGNETRAVKISQGGYYGI